MIEEDMRANEKTYVVEKLMDRRSLEGYQEYLVKWKDYPESLATWEPRDVLMETIAFVVERFDAMVDKDQDASMKSNATKRFSKKSGKKAPKESAKSKPKKKYHRLSPPVIKDKEQLKPMFFMKE
jgi:hypothetical protein